MAELMNYSAQVILALGVLAFLVTLITQVTKTLPYISKIPTQIEAFVLSIVFSVVGLIIYIQVKEITVEWYFYLGAVVFGFIVSYLVENGWESLTKLWKRFVREEK